MTHLAQNQVTSLGWKLQRTESNSSHRCKTDSSAWKLVTYSHSVHVWRKNYLMRHCAINKTILSGLSSQFCSIHLMCFYQRHHTLTYETARICIPVHNYTGGSKEVCMFLCLLIWDLACAGCCFPRTNLSIRNSFITQRLVPHLCLFF